uniref:Possible membrane associated protease n=1 Tax=Paulinella chromatophora TaxID=39717 RepID=B1X5S5_PAUCH|nr:Possible membrane associated protease [Paulinella chromatophora]ACB43294.1 Possible membrane associated protease [Paulinella chromatophora]
MNRVDRDAYLPSWKNVLALLSLILSVFIWVAGLAGSLQRPSVTNSLELRRLELASIASPLIQNKITKILVGEKPEEILLETLNDRYSSATGDLHLYTEREVLLRTSLLAKQQQSFANEFSKDNFLKFSPKRSLSSFPVRNYWSNTSLETLNNEKKEQLVLPIYSDPLLLRISCEVLGKENCEYLASERKAFFQLLNLILAPVFALVIGLSLVLRQIWLGWKGKSLSLPVLLAPSFSLIDMVLLIAGGFVALGETVSSLLVIPLAQVITNLFNLTSPFKEAVSIVLLYLGLAAMPLLILALMFQNKGLASSEGFLQLHWKPWKSTFSQSIIYVLSICPLVILVERLNKLIMGEPSGSNPLMILILTSHNTVALVLFCLPAIFLAPLFEELIFRGVLLPILGRKFGSGWGILLSALVFGIAHLSLSELAPLVALGLGLGLLRVQSGRLAPCVLMHAFWNSFTIINLVLLGS